MAFVGGYLCTNNDSKYIPKITNYLYLYTEIPKGGKEVMNENV